MKAGCRVAPTSATDSHAGRVPLAVAEGTILANGRYGLNPTVAGDLLPALTRERQGSLASTEVVVATADLAGAGVDTGLGGAIVVIHVFVSKPGGNRVSVRVDQSHGGASRPVETSGKRL